MPIYGLIETVRDIMNQTDTRFNRTARQVYGTRYYVLCALGLVVLFAGGATYTHFSTLWRGTGAGPIDLPVPLEDIPLNINGWTGMALSIPSTTQNYMRSNFADDFVSRRYINEDKRAWADVYVVYCASRPPGIKGHRPRVCYRGFGWIHDDTLKDHVVSRSGRDIPCLVHRFHKPSPGFQEVVVLNFYVASGVLTTDEDSFMKILGRRPNTEGDFTRYVAQVQISSGTENAIRLAAADIIDTVFDFLPDANGKVEAAKHSVAKP